MCDAKISPPPPRAPSAERLCVRPSVRSIEMPRAKPPPPSSRSVAVASPLLSVPLPARLQCAPCAGLRGRPHWGLGSPLLHGGRTPVLAARLWVVCAVPSSSLLLPLHHTHTDTHRHTHTHTHTQTQTHTDTHTHTHILVLLFLTLSKTLFPILCH